MLYDRLLEATFQDYRDRLRPIRPIVQERSDDDHVRVVQGHGRAAARELLRLLGDLPAAAGAPDTESFVLGFHQASAGALPDDAVAALRQWHGWLFYLYEAACDLRLDDGPREVQLDFVKRFTQIVRNELDDLLAARIIYWKPELEDLRWR